MNWMERKHRQQVAGWFLDGVYVLTGIVSFYCLVVLLYRVLM